VFLLLIRDQKVEGSNPFAPTNPTAGEHFFPQTNYGHGFSVALYRAKVQLGPTLERIFYSFGDKAYTGNDSSAGIACLFSRILLILPARAAA